MSTTLEKIKASAKDLNSLDPKLRARAEEIKRRYQQGLFNAELEKEGAKPVPIKKPNFEAVDMSTALGSVPQQEGQMSVPQPSMLDTAKEMGGDVLQTAQNIGGTIQEGAQNIQNIVGNDNLNIAQKSMGVLGSLLGTGARTIGDVATGVGKVALTQDAEDQLKSFITEKAQGLAENEKVKAMAEWYGNLTPENKLIVDSAGGFMALVSEVVGGGTAGKVATPLKEGIGTAIETGVDLTKAGLKKADELSIVNKTNRVAKQESKVDEAVARIIQGTPEDIATAKKALMEVDTDGVKTYAELNERMGETLDTLRKKVDQELDADTTIYTKFKLARETEVKGLDGKTTKVYDNPTLSALDELEEYYTKIKDIPSKTKVAQYKQKLEAEGLRLKDINDIARMHGKDLNAFNANGELASGLSKQAAENTRKGLKEVVRQNMPDDKTRALDESMSNILRTQDLTKDMETKVQKLYQKVKNRTLAQKVGGAAADVVDMVSFGTLRGFVQKLLPSNVGLKTANSMDLEKELAKNLKQVEKLLQMKEGPEFDAALKSLINESTPQSKVPDSSFNSGAIHQTNGASVIQSQAAVKRTTDTSDVILRDLAKKHKVDYDQLNTVIDTKLSKAEAWKKYADTEAEKIIQGVPDTKVAVAPIKSKQRILEKTLKEEEGNVENIKDIARNTIVPSTPEARATVLKRMDARKDLARPRKDQRPEDFMGYEGTIYNIRTPDGQIVETQVVSPEMTFGKNLPEFSKSVLGEDVFNEIAKRTGLEPGLGHVYYEKLRAMSNAEMLSPEGQELIQKSFDYYSKLR